MRLFAKFQLCNGKHGATQKSGTDNFHAHGMNFNCIGSNKFSYWLSALPNLTVIWKSSSTTLEYQYGELKQGYGNIDKLFMVQA